MILTLHPLNPSHNKLTVGLSKTRRYIRDFSQRHPA